jgi:hypothetical protein
MIPAAFSPGGQKYTLVAESMADVPKRDRVAGTLVALSIAQLMHEDQVTELGEDITDGFLQGYSWLKGFSRDFIQRGLRVCEQVKGIFGRKRQHGRRTISMTEEGRFLASRGGSPSPSPHTPLPLKREREETTTTEGQSSSSLEKTLEKTPTPEDPAHAGLIARARGLIGALNPGRVLAAVAEFSAEWVDRALDRVEERNRKPGNKPVSSWGFVLGVLRNYHKEGGPPPPKAAPQSQPSGSRRSEASPEEKPQPLTAEQVAELVEQARSGHRAMAQIAATNLRVSVRDGLISPELLATIPAGILDPENPRAP